MTVAADLFRRPLNSNAMDLAFNFMNVGCGCAPWKGDVVPVGASPTRRSAPAGSNRSSRGGNEAAEAFGEACHEIWWQRECAGRNASERQASLEKDDA
jgi:hypothetical protein